MAVVNQAELSRLVGRAKSTICEAVKTGKLKVQPNGLIDLSHPTNAYWYEQRKPKLASVVAAKKSKRGRKPKPKSDKKPFEALPKAPQTLESMPDMSDIPDDLGVLSTESLDRLKKIADIQQKQVKTDAERKKLVPRKDVRMIFSKLYMIHVNQIRRLGDNISATIAAALGVEDDKKVLEISRIVEKETFKILKQIKRLFSDYLKKIKAGGLME